NGIQDPGEPGVPGVKVYLLDYTNNIVDSTATDQNGAYVFYQRMGQFRIQFVVPEGQLTSPQGMGSDSEMDSDADENGLTYLFEVQPGERRTDIDMGLQCVPIIIVVNDYKEI